MTDDHYIEPEIASLEAVAEAVVDLQKRLAEQNAAIDKLQEQMLRMLEIQAAQQQTINDQQAAIAGLIDRVEGKPIIVRPN